MNDVDIIRINDCANEIQWRKDVIHAIVLLSSIVPDVLDKSNAYDEAETQCRKIDELINTIKQLTE